MKKSLSVSLILTLVISCAEKNDDKLKELQSDDFKNKVADKIAKKIPDYPKFGNKEQKVLAKDIVDIIANELNNTKKEPIERVDKTSNESIAKAKKSADEKAAKAKKLADEKAAAEAKRLAEEKAAEAERLANLDKSREEGEFKDGERDGLWTV